MPDNSAQVAVLTQIARNQQASPIAQAQNDARWRQAQAYFKRGRPDVRQQRLAEERLTRMDNRPTTGPAIVMKPSDHEARIRYEEMRMRLDAGLAVLEVRR